MSLRSKIILNSLFGAIGGFLGWAVSEVLLRWFFSVPADKHTSVEIAISNAELGLLAGFFIGGALGAAEGLASPSRAWFRRMVVVGSLAGAAGGFLGLSIGQTVFDLIMPNSGSESIGYFFFMVIGHSVGWAIVGAVIGASQGLASLSLSRLKHGAIGGLIGGFIGGMLFDMLTFILQTDVVSRMASLTLTGLVLGFMIALIQDLLKQAWVVVIRSGNEGRQIPIYKMVTTIGRDELADVPIFMDQSVALRQAVIKQENGRHVLYDSGTTFGTEVNGKKVTRQILKDRDTIEMGSVKLLFREKATASRYVVSPNTPRSDPVHIPSSDRICPFCGGVKDAGGNCDCTVGATTGAAPPTMMQDPFAQAAPISVQPTISQPAPVAPGQARLTAIGGPHASAVWILLPAETTIGREDTRDVALTGDSAVSRRHARVVREDSGYVVYDEGSSNGTFVNGSRITRTALMLGDVIQVGATELRFEA